MSSFFHVVLVAAGGFVGSVSRYYVSQFAVKRRVSKIPWGTLFVNLTGAFLLGLLYGAHSPSSVLLLAGTGFMGAYTTFSTFMHETMSFALNKQGYLSMLYLCGSLLLGIALAYVGMQTGEGLFG
ncbi:fluoride efflux transporter FluC [Gorillibacterium massiliense]|uniref:fluoride efflux transporter FluC n=1 Tax=Gorillibacterium massiliense TaxID=1280390 RepID=UPI0004ACB36D|nr:CrcB family protein [Gorillibacterium massiliense]